ncbi:zinc ABC transporter substrate-binding protein [Serpentinicella sp. ANB-PHB4]|uniref:metal ABC transporter solute-binding protein, Zn/Mn family n=1 Tax=Serpentinicella sp. ANB-PHB4 TaxID=3074076 RepID=UPI0028552938|nr:zinc ABC transporter substrate-binding protein [Serpentinicella sp. ANB-PHB4]MDR5659597.1 zinc ABC transporter substrate-binding protein [Serpentinicella sp. ANB-PHB4]
MYRKKITYFLSITLILTTMLFTGCSTNQQVTREEDQIHVITTISILADITENILGDLGTVEYLVPIGEEPEEYEPIPSDFRKVSDAKLLIANGLEIEPWLERVTNVTEMEPIYLTDGGPTIPLVGGSGLDPHLWLDVSLVKDYYVDNLLEALIEIDSDNEAIYTENAETYKQELEELDNWIYEQVKIVPEKNRYVVISENAYKYFGDAYGFQTEGIWELNSHEEGTPQQISRIVELVKEKDLPSIFVETTVSPRYMEMVSKEANVPIAGAIYSDALGVEGSGQETYINMMKHNVEVIVNGLK